MTRVTQRSGEIHKTRDGGIGARACHDKEFGFILSMLGFEFGEMTF